MGLKGVALPPTWQRANAALRTSVRALADLRLGQL